MKIAVCMFGLPRGNVKECHELVKYHFGDYDFFYGTWSKHANDLEAVLPDVPYLTTPEPIINYHPYFDVKIFRIIIKKERVRK